MRLNAADRRKLEREFRRGLADWRLHSYRIEGADLPAAGFRTVLEAIAEA